MGTISTTVSGPVTLSNPLLDNPLVVTATGAVSSVTPGSDGIDGTNAASWIITNDGSIASATGRGISLAAGGTISNGLISGTAASISGSIAGIAIYGGTGAVTNDGRLSGQYGVTLGLGGTVTNNVGGS